MKRLHLFIPLHLIAWLKKESAKRGITVSEVVRRIIEKAASIE